MFNLFKNNYKTANAIAVVALAMSVGLGACSSEEEAMSPESPETTVEDVAEEPEEVAGEQVEVMGEVEEILSDNTFRLQEDGEVIDDDSILVIDVAGTEPISEDQEVRVMGEVRTLVIADVEKEYNLTWDADIRKQIEAEYEGKPVLIAESTMMVEPGEDAGETESAQ
ncbi:MAG: hypothetical protein SAJ12_14670 [Jaaginema sp. PMC 1079.18]|nr:hypothetical protein [Jaaginema sp. PMC 1080.18]MEC4852228.1 hypothetical protein [Jaaginema sp. PMC 1079.18]MEC4866972.1 hypothetical protein [Jaaginema sp. PMC 1078.18]